MQKQSQKESAWHLNLEFVFLGSVVVFIYAIIYFYFNVTLLLFNCLVTFILGCIIFVTFREYRFAKIVNIFFQLIAAYNIIISILFVGWGYGFEFYIAGLSAVYYLYLIEKSAKRTAFLLAQSALYIFLYFYAHQMPPVYGDENFKKIVYLINFTLIFVAFFFLYRRLNIVEIAKILDTQKRSEKYQKIIKIDFLTKIFNRQKIMEIVSDNLSKLKQSKIDSICLVLCDIDDFKGINDKFGHLFGDEILISVAQILKQNFQKYGEIGRYGGEEFLACIVNQNEDNLKQIINNARLQIQLSKPNNIDVTMTFGAIFVTKIRADVTVEMLIYEVDLALYQGKADGKNGLVFRQAKSRYIC